jgi:hypothetical protein
VREDTVAAVVDRQQACIPGEVLEVVAVEQEVDVENNNLEEDFESIRQERVGGVVGMAP